MIKIPIIWLADKFHNWLTLKPTNEENRLQNTALFLATMIQMFINLNRKQMAL